MARPTISERLLITISQASRHQRQFRHHTRKVESEKWSAKSEDAGHQMTVEGTRSVGRKYKTQREMVESWEKSTERLESGRAMMRAGAGVGQPHKAKNKFSKEEMGTLSNYIGVCRFDNSYITKACYRKKMW